jgi:arsenate reductase
LAEGTDEQKYQVFKQVALQIRRRIELFLALPIEKLDRLKLTELTQNIGSKEQGIGRGGAGEQT